MRVEWNGGGGGSAAIFEVFYSRYRMYDDKNIPWKDLYIGRVSNFYNYVKSTRYDELLLNYKIIVIDFLDFPHFCTFSISLFPFQFV